MESEQHSPQIELWLKLIRAEGIGPTLFKRLLDYFEDVEHIFTASVAELTKIEGIGNKTAESIVRTRDAFDVDSEIGLADKLGDIQVITLWQFVLESNFDRIADFYVPKLVAVLKEARQYE